jgi:predicted porin
VYRQTDSGLTTSKIASNVNSTSVLGFRGTEDLGGGMVAGFHLLSELSLPEGQVGSYTSGDAAPNAGQKNNLFTRAANIYLEGKETGKFEIGRIQDVVWQTQGAFNNTGSNSLGFAAFTATQTNFGALVSQAMGTASADTTFSGTTYTTGGAVTAANNAQSGSAPINFNAGWGYTTPTFYGIKATYQHVGNQFQTGTPATSIAAATGNAYRVEYTNGPLNVQWAQTSRQDKNDALGAKWTVIGATYQMGAAKLVGAQSKLTTSGTFSTIDGNTVTGFGVIYDVNAMIDVGAGYTTLKDDSATSAAAGQTAKLIGLTARYKFTKRTQLYAGYGKESQGSALKVTPFYGGPASTTAAGAGATGYLVGVRHSF